MKHFKYILLLGIVGLFNSCVKDLLDQQPTTEVSSDLFWKTTDDALTSTIGVYQAARTLFGRDYYFDGIGEFQQTRGTSGGSVGNNFYQTNGGSFGGMWNDAYRVINRANFTIENIEAMIQRTTHEETKKRLERVNGENYFLRALAYFRLIQLWGDVPYYTKVLEGDEEAITLSRMPINEIKDNLIQDLTYAVSVLPARITSTSERGRATQVAALAFRGKIELYWASWKKYGWPELDGFTQNANEAQQAYQKAADDFRKVINDYGLKLFSEGNPGTYDNPSYGRLFQYYSEYDPEIIFSVQFGGPNLGQGEEMLRDFGTRTTGNAQCWVMPCSRLVDRYQSLITGDFAEPLVLENNPATPNGSLNPQSYENRDWRMKATLLWDGETIQGISNDGYSMTGTFIMKLGVREAPYINNDASGQTGYLYRKWIRQEPIAERSQGPQDFYLMRLADVYLMYCEAVNEVSGPSAELVSLVDKIRERGNLPGLAPAKYADKAAFFEAIKQERIVELVAEGIRPFDIRRWREAESIWGGPQTPGWPMYNTQGGFVRDQLRNVDARTYERFYIYKISDTDRSRNPNLTQNRPWL
ncbi:MAG: RagB/SusD family nutrient uptake outer membrane protein [Tannerella sp.]|jgi:hypothetical protein|nr:RagB/SusD family nutrient uptake outer membrane protein [Tannerella sp.]